MVFNHSEFINEKYILPASHVGPMIYGCIWHMSDKNANQTQIYTYHKKKFHPTHTLYVVQATETIFVWPTRNIIFHLFTWSRYIGPNFVVVSHSAVSEFSLGF